MSSKGKALVWPVGWGDLLFIGGFLILPVLIILTSVLSLRRQRRSARSHQHEAVAESASPAADPEPPVPDETAPDTPDTAGLSPSAARVPVRRRWDGVFIRRKRGSRPIRAARRVLRLRKKRPR